MFVEYQMIKIVTYISIYFTCRPYASSAKIRVTRQVHKI